jgi:endonuclease IV
MSENEKPVLERIADALEKIAEQLDNVSTSTYVLASESMDMNGQLARLIEQLEVLLKTPLKVTVDFASFQKALETQTTALKPKTPEPPEHTFPLM